jgi:hypothetical protein
LNYLVDVFLRHAVKPGKVKPAWHNFQTLEQLQRKGGVWATEITGFALSLNKISPAESKLI